MYLVLLNLGSIVQQDFAIFHVQNNLVSQCPIQIVHTQLQFMCQFHEKKNITSTSQVTEILIPHFLSPFSFNIAFTFLPGKMENSFGKTIALLFCRTFLVGGRCSVFGSPILKTDLQASFTYGLKYCCYLYRVKCRFMNNRCHALMFFIVIRFLPYLGWCVDVIC